MYLIRVDQARRLLTLELSGHVTTDEAVAAMCIVAEIVRTDGLKAARCDTFALEYGPDRPAAVAAALAAVIPAELRLAFAGPEEHRRGLRHLLRLAHVANAKVFTSHAETEEWLAEVIGHRTSLPSTARRHVDDLLAANPPPASPGAATAPQRISAA
jgi:hypothetical protein